MRKRRKSQTLRSFFPENRVQAFGEKFNSLKAAEGFQQFQNNLQFLDTQQFQDIILSSWFVLAASFIS
jgi:hypothetical protein